MKGQRISSILNVNVNITSAIFLANHILFSAGLYEKKWKVYAYIYIYNLCPIFYVYICIIYIPVCIFIIHFKPK